MTPFIDGIIVSSVIFYNTDVTCSDHSTCKARRILFVCGKKEMTRVFYGQIVGNQKLGMR